MSKARGPSGVSIQYVFILLALSALVSAYSSVAEAEASARPKCRRDLVQLSEPEMIIDGQTLRFASADLNLLRSPKTRSFAIEITVQGLSAFAFEGLSDQPLYLTLGEPIPYPSTELRVQPKYNTATNELKLEFRSGSISRRQQKLLRQGIIDALDNADQLEISVRGQPLQIISALFEIRADAGSCQK